MIKEILNILLLSFSAAFASLSVLLVLGGAEVGVNLSLTNKEAALGCILVAIYLLILFKKV